MRGEEKKGEEGEEGEEERRRGGRGGRGEIRETYHPTCPSQKKQTSYAVHGVQHDVRRRKRRVSNKERCEADRLM